LVDTVGQRNLYVDFDQVPGLTSGQIGGLLGLHKRLRARGGHLILGRVNPSLYEVFDRMRLTRLLDIRPGLSPGGGIECVELSAAGVTEAGPSISGRSTPSGT
jgi:hypothetical protein